MPSRYDHFTHDELVRLLEARDRRDATRFGLEWEANEIERDRAVNGTHSRREEKNNGSEVRNFI